MKAMKKCLALLLTLLLILPAAVPALGALTAFAAPEGDTNVALNKPITASKSDNGTNPTVVNDGHKSAYWDGGPGPASVTIDLGGWYTISEIMVLTYVDGNRSYLHDVEVSDDNSYFELVAQKAEHKTETNEGTVHNLSDKDVTARFVRITMVESSLAPTGNASVHLREIEIYGHENETYVPQDRNVALNKPVTATAGTNANKVVDGKTNKNDGYWDGGAAPASVTVDLGSWYKLSEIKVFPYASSSSRSYLYTIEVSTNNLTYTLVAEKTEHKNETTDGTAYDLSDKDITAKYVRITMTANTANNAVHLCELEVWGKLDTDFTPAPGEPLDVVDITSDLSVYSPGAETWHNHSGYPDYQTGGYVTQFLVSVTYARQNEFLANGMSYVDSRTDAEAGTFTPMQWSGGHFELEITDILGKTTTVQVNPATWGAWSSTRLIYRFETCEAGFQIKKGDIYDIRMNVYADNGMIWYGDVKGLSISSSSDIYNGGQKVEDDTIDTTLLNSYPSVVEFTHYGSADKSDFEKKNNANAIVVLANPDNMPHGMADLKDGYTIKATVNGEVREGKILTHYGMIGSNYLFYLDLGYTDEEMAALEEGKFYACAMEVYNGEAMLYKANFAMRVAGMTDATNPEKTVIAADGSETTLGAYNAAVANDTAVYQCGDKLTATIIDGTLVIRGSGAMYDYADAAELPWSDRAEEITSVVVLANLTSIGDYGFAGLTNLTEFVIPSTVTAIGSGAFAGCENITVTYCGSEEDWTAIAGEHSDLEVQLHQITLWETVETATCTEAGSEKSVCEVCGEEITREIPATGHTPGAEATCTEAQVCEICNEVLVEALGHDYEVTVVEPTYTEEGYTLHTCTRCDDSYKDEIVPPLTVENLGDMNGDGVVTPIDRMLLTRYLESWEGYDSIDLAAADFDGDGEVTARDRTILSRHIAGWAGYEDLRNVSI